MAAPLMEHMDHPMEVAPSKHQLHRMEPMAHPTEPLPRKHHQEILQLMGHPLHHPMVPQERLNRRQEGLRDPTLEQRQRHPTEDPGPRMHPLSRQRLSAPGAPGGTAD